MLLEKQLHSAIEELESVYVDFLKNELALLLEEVPLAKRMRMVFQHDGAPAHYSRLVTHHLNLTFPECWIGLGGHQGPQTLLH